MGREELTCFLEQLAHKGGAPAVPEGRIGRVDVRHREGIEVAETLFRLDHPRECGEDLRIANVLALSHVGHKQVLANKPADQFPFGGL